MHGLFCDVCGEGLLLKSNVRYVVKVEVYAAYDPLEITEEDLAQANQENWEKLLEELRHVDPDKATSQIYVSFKYDLCRDCRMRYVEDPLRGLREKREEKKQDKG